MGFLNFFIRFLKPLLIIVLSTGLLIGLAYASRLLFRELWEAFEVNFTEQAKWFLARFNIFKPWKFWIMAISGLAMLICIGAFVSFVVFSGQGAEGTIIP